MVQSDQVIYYDIETYKSRDAESVIGKKDFKAPSNYKDPLKIEASIEEQRKAALDRSALHWTTGKIVCICAIADASLDRFEMAGDVEEVILANFTEWISKYPDAVLCGKSNHIFDDGFMVGRYMANRMKMPHPLTRKTLDINSIFGYGNRHPQHAKLNEYSIALGLGEKLAEGWAVAKMVENNEWDDIRAYCMKDVLLTQEIGNIYHRCGGWL